MATITRGEIAAYDQKRLRKSNSVRRCEMVHSSALNFLFYDPHFTLFLNHNASSPKSRLATASAGKEDPGRGHDEKSKAGRPGRRRPAMATPETGAGVDCHDV